MESLDKTFSCRLNNDEQNYLDKYWDDGFSSYVHNSIKRDISLVEKNKKNNFLQDTSAAVIKLGVGCIILIYSLSIGNTLGFWIAFLLSIFFIISGLVEIYLHIFKKIGRGKDGFRRIFRRQRQ